jgi:hypothetical protein
VQQAQFCLLFHASFLLALLLDPKTKMICSSETSDDCQQTLLHYNSAGRILQIYVKLHVGLC